MEAEILYCIARAPPRKCKVFGHHTNELPSANMGVPRAAAKQSCHLIIRTERSLVVYVCDSNLLLNNLYARFNPITISVGLVDLVGIGPA